MCSEIRAGIHVGHVGWDARSPDALDVAFGQGVTDRVDGIESELAGCPVLVDTAEHVVVQTAKG